MNGLALERATVNAAVWGDQAAYLLPELAAAEFTDPWCEVAALAVVVAVENEAESLLTPHRAEAVHGLLVEYGHHAPDDFHRLVLADVEPGTLHALPWLLHRLSEEAEHRRLMGRLVGLADTLTHPGGPERVAAILGAAAA